MKGVCAYTSVLLPDTISPAVTVTETKDSSRRLSLQQGQHSGAEGHAHTGKAAKDLPSADTGQPGDRQREANPEPAPGAPRKPVRTGAITYCLPQRRAGTLAVGMSIILPFMNTFCCSAHLNHTLKEEHMFKQDIVLK